MQMPTVTGNATLPRRVKPVPNEMLDDYLNRLAKANGINQTRLRSLLERRGKSIREGLSVATGMSDRAIAFALPELRVAADVTDYQGVPAELAPTPPDQPARSARPATASEYPTPTSGRPTTTSSANFTTCG